MTSDDQWQYPERSVLFLSPMWMALLPVVSMCDTDMSKPVASLVIVQAQKVQTSSTASTLQRCEGPCGWWYLNWGVFISSYIKTHRSLFLIFSLYIGIAVSAIITIYIYITIIVVVYNIILSHLSLLQPGWLLLLWLYLSFFMCAIQSIIIATNG